MSHDKEKALTSLLKELGSTIVAFSGGADSAYLAWAAGRALGDAALAVTADSPSLPRRHLREAQEFAQAFQLRHEILPTRELENPLYAQNHQDRCFYCKDELFASLEALAAERGISSICYGVNADDLSDFRPGHQAAHQHQVRSPLLEVGLTKQEIRELSRAAGLPTWNRPAAACLSSRIPYGTPVTKENLDIVERGEEALTRLGFRQFRVRLHGDTVRLEIAPEELPRALSVEMVKELVTIFKGLGFRFVTLDLEGYRQGSLNIL